MQVPSKNPDSGLLVATLVFPVEQKVGRLAVIGLAPNKSGTCDGSYQEVAYVNSSCDKFVAKEFPGRPVTMIGESGVVIVPLNRNARVLATPAENGCVTVKQEILD